MFSSDSMNKINVTGADMVLNINVTKTKLRIFNAQLNLNNAVIERIHKFKTFGRLRCTEITTIYMSRWKGTITWKCVCMQMSWL